MLEYLQAFRPATLLKRDFNTGVSLWNLQHFKNTYFQEHLQTNASVDNLQKNINTANVVWLKQNQNTVFEHLKTSNRFSLFPLYTVYV